MVDNFEHKPNLFVIGAAKSGTTSLYYYLSQHPQVYLSPIKEPNFFSDDIEVENFTSTYKKNNYLNVDQYFSDKPLKDLHLTFVRNSKQYLSLFDASKGEKIKGEFSTSYLFSSSAAKNIFNFNPGSKIIAILRNPIERAFSHYQMALRFGYTDLPFKKAIEKDIKAKEKGWGISELFIELGMYYDQLKRYYDVFPKEQVKVFLFDEFKNEKQKLLNDCCSFLEIDTFGFQESEIYNKGQNPKFPKINRILVKSGIKEKLQRITPDKIQQKLKKSLFEDVGNKIDKNDSEFLVNIYQSDIEKTSDLIGKDLSFWINNYSSTS